MRLQTTCTLRFHIKNYLFHSLAFPYCWLNIVGGESGARGVSGAEGCDG